MDGFSDEAAKILSQSVQRSIGRKFPGEVINNHGGLEFSGRTFELAIGLSQVLKEILNNSGAIRIPERKGELQALVEILIEGLVGQEIYLTVPVCPDYGRGDNFYQQMGTGVSPEARGGVGAAKVLMPIFEKAGISARMEILVADTETDIPEVIQRCAGGDAGKYIKMCVRSKEKIAKLIKGSERVKVMTFTEKFGDDFRQTQREFEGKIRRIMASDPVFARKIRGVAEQRVARHAQILGRSEQNLELSVRYAAQYAAMGRILKTKGGNNLVLNYQTPNREYFNATVNVHQELFIDQKDKEIIPVLGTVVRREA